MDLNIIRIIWYIQLFIILMYFHDKTSCLTCNKPDLCILKKICIIRDYNMHQLPTNPTCSSIGLFGDKYTDFSADIKDINKLRNGYPLVYIDNHDDHNQLLNQIRPQNLDEFLKKKNDFIKANNINAMIFDNLYTPRDTQIVSERLNRNTDHIRIHGFIRALKIQNPNVLIGIMISYIEENLDDINVAYYDKVFDFYAFDTVEYNMCTKSTDIATPVDELNKTIIHMKSLGFDMEKSVIIIDLYVTESCYVSSDTISGCRILSYGDCCSNNNNELVVCVDTLADYYHKALFVNTHNMAGAIIESITDDDFASKCCCGRFPGLIAIDAGINGCAEPNITKCDKWGHYQKSC